MSKACQDRRSRWQEIQKGLQFIQSTLPYPGSQEQYEVFIKDLVWNLFGEGNDVYKEGDWTKSIEMYTEALSIAEYADSEEICVPTGVMEKLYANRAAAYLNVVPGLYDQALEDCEKALQLNSGNYKALYRKAKSLKEMGRHKEAYETVAKCSLVVPQDPSVMQLTQDLAKILGLKIRKAYVRTKGSNYQDASFDKLPNGSASVEDIEVEMLKDNQADNIMARIEAPSAGDVPVNEAPVEEFPHNNSISSVMPSEPLGFDSLSLPVSVNTSVGLPALTFVNGCRTVNPCPILETNQDFDTDIIGSDLDDLLDQADPELNMDIPTVKGPLPLPTSNSSGSSLSSPFLMSSHINPFLHSGTQLCTVTLPPLYSQSGTSTYFGMDTFDAVSQPLDSLDSLSMNDYKSDFGPCPFLPQINSGNTPMGMAVGMPEMKGIPAAVDLAKKPIGGNT